MCFFQDTNGLVFRALPTALGAMPCHDRSNRPTDTLT